MLSSFTHIALFVAKRNDCQNVNLVFFPNSYLAIKILEHHLRGINR